MMKSIEQKTNQLLSHPIYLSLQDLSSLKIFMEYHVFAVWDFMSLLKSLQCRLTSITLPWKPSPYKASLVRMINEIVLAEESDEDNNAEYSSHFELYLKAMEEIGANTAPIRHFIVSLDYETLPDGIREFVSYNVNLALSGETEEIASAFLYGREKLLPDLFQSIFDILKCNVPSASTLLYYLHRHIELDGETHGPLAQKCLDEICGQDRKKLFRAEKAALTSLSLRFNLWDEALKEIKKKKDIIFEPQFTSSIN